MLLTHEARLEQDQSAKLLFTPNCGIMHSNYSQARRGGFGFGRYQGHLHSGNRNHNVGRGIFFNEYSGGFRTSSNSFGKGHSTTDAISHTMITC